jgi:hypothetical protein
LRTVLALFVVTSLSIVAAADAHACVCADEPLDRRLDDADAALVGRIVGTSETSVGGIRQSLYRIDVIQRVKGDVPREIVVRSPLGSDCDLVDAAAPPIAEDGTTGLLLARAPDGAWLASACSVVGAGELVAAGGEPRGGVIKVVIGLVILGLVLLWALRRLRRGTRPDLPGAPRP